HQSGQPASCTMTEPSVSRSGLAAPGKPSLQSLVGNGGWLLSACHGEAADVVDAFAATARAAAAVTTAARGPRGGIGFSRNAWAWASPKQASAAETQTTFVSVRNLMEAPFMLVRWANEDRCNSNSDCFVRFPPYAMRSHSRPCHASATQPVVADASGVTALRHFPSSAGGARERGWSSQACGRAARA